MTDATSPGTPAVERQHPPDALMRVVNPIMRTVLRLPTHRLVDGHLLLLTFTGRRSGRTYQLPVGYHWIDGRLCLLTNSGWRVNFRGGRPVVVRHRGEVHRGTATLEEDPGHVADVYARLIDDMGHEQAGRRLGLRINVDRAPTHEELVEAVRRSGLSTVVLDVGVPAPGQPAET